MKKILFQGDSITDFGRNVENDRVNFGHGYANFVKGKLMFEEPGKYEMFNRGVGGNRIVDVYARIKADIINLQPDVMSILIGVNDVWHELIRKNGVSAEKFEKIYDMLILEVIEALPNIKIIILEPFVLKGSGTLENWEYFAAETPKRAAAAKRIAEKYNLPFVELQSKFDELSKDVAPDYWAEDGVHPSPAGHELIAREWIKAFRAL